MSEEKNKAADSLKAITESKELTDRMGKIKHKIMVLSGKGGVGKSTVAANIAVSLALEGKKIGLLDTDFHGPSIPTLLNLEGRQPGSDGKAILPIEFSEGLKVMSIGFLLQNKDDAVIWRGPMKMKVIKQLLTEVNWGDLDYLIIDFPPGTGDEPLSVAQLIPGMDGAVIVTTPQNLSLNDVKKCINFCRQLSVPVLGVVENMSGLVCPNCKTIINVFKTGGGEKMASEMGVPFLGKIPIDSQIVEASDSGKPFVYHYSKTEAAKAFTGVVQPLLQIDGKTESETKTVSSKEEEKGMHKIAIPVVEGHLSAHFGHCEEFAIFDVDLENKKIVGQEKAPSPPHEPGLLPKWLAEKGVNIIIAGGMGTQAQQLFANSGITVSVGASADDPEKVIISYMNNALELGGNTCDH
ncbi:MAG: iron-sulfur cluster carrier protein MrpORP [Thermodesulfobacteriota bacterium]|nr:iron-sulfur cluster carrier protein MrpORP [Thermodesulfobacteriota bacterium]